MGSDFLGDHRTHQETPPPGASSGVHQEGMGSAHTTCGMLAGSKWNIYLNQILRVAEPSSAGPAHTRPPGQVIPLAGVREASYADQGTLLQLPREGNNKVETKYHSLLMSLSSKVGWAQ